MQWLQGAGWRDARHFCPDSRSANMDGVVFPTGHPDFPQTEEISMRLSILGAVILGLTPISSFAASECRVTGSPSVFGVDMTVYFAIAAGKTCLFPIRIPGVMNSSGVARKPSHGTLRQLNVTTFTYTAARGYNGADSFAIQGTGKGPIGSGTTTITVNATIQ
jgi:hypothetical protein